MLLLLLLLWEPKGAFPRHPCCCVVVMVLVETSRGGTDTDCIQLLMTQPVLQGNMHCQCRSAGVCCMATVWSNGDEMQRHAEADISDTYIACL
jgi:hypothetical protein